MENPNVTSTIIEIVENQIEATDPPITKKTYKRLLSQGFSEEKVVKQLELDGRSAKR